MLFLFHWSIFTILKASGLKRHFTALIWHAYHMYIFTNFRSKSFFHTTWESALHRRPIIIVSAHPLTVVCCFHLRNVCVSAWIYVNVLWAIHLKGFSWFMISAQNPNKLNRREEEEREGETGKYGDRGERWVKDAREKKRNRMQVRPRKITAWRWSRQHS